MIGKFRSIFLASKCHKPIKIIRKTKRMRNSSEYIVELSKIKIHMIGNRRLINLEL